MPKDNSIQSILIIGSGPIVIGQACEFDYSGSQATRSLAEEGIEVSLINSNPATIMTDPVVADHVYLKPLTVESIEEILSERKIDAVLPTMGGQTALNLCIEADEKGVWEKYDVEIIGVDIEAINITEDRQEFKELMSRIGIDCAPSQTATSYLEGKEIAQKFGITNFLYYSLIKTGFLPPLIFMGVGALTDFGPMLRNLRLVFFGAAAQIGIFTVLIISLS